MPSARRVSRRCVVDDDQFGSTFDEGVNDLSFEFVMPGPFAIRDMQEVQKGFVDGSACALRRHVDHHDGNPAALPVVRLLTFDRPFVEYARGPHDCGLADP